MKKISEDITKRKPPKRRKPIIAFRKVNANMITSLNKTTIKYFFTGALAVNYYGRPRTSMDVDVMVERNKKKLDLLVKTLRKKGFDVIQRDVDEALKNSSHFSVFSRDSPYYFDFKVVPESEKRVFKNLRTVMLYGRKTFLSSPEDLIVNKIVFGSEQDINDVKSIIRRWREKLDHNYLFNLADSKGILHKLKKLWEE